MNPEQDYIKRVVGIPGDEVSYQNQRLYINGQLRPCSRRGDFYDDSGSPRLYRPRFTEKLGEREHQILVEPKQGALFRPDANFRTSTNATTRSRA